MTTGNRNLIIAGAVAAALAGVSLLRKKAVDFSYHEKVVLITGGSRGLGLVMARELAKEGAKVVICARDPHELEIAHDDLQARGAVVLAIQCDVTIPEQVREMVGIIHENFGVVDVLINNAGTINVGPENLMTLKDYEMNMNTHFWGPLHTMMEVLPGMRKRGEGRIVNISSIGGKISIPHLVPYCASKFALVGLSQGMRSELAGQGISVTTVCPGLMRTGSYEHAFFKGNHREEFTWFSILDSMPGTSIDAHKAARSIIEACRRGDAELVITLQARFLTKLNVLFPEASAHFLEAMNSWLPDAEGGVGTKRIKGKYSHSDLAPSLLTSLGDKAARENNELPHAPAM